MFGVLPPVLLDAWLMRQFPNRTLEELDNLDFGRLWRVLACQAVLRAEDVRDLQMQGKYEPTPAEWRMIRRNDRLTRKPYQTIRSPLPEE